MLAFGQRKTPTGSSPWGYYRLIIVNYTLETNTRFKVEVVQIVVGSAAAKIAKTVRGDRCTGRVLRCIIGEEVGESGFEVQVFAVVVRCVDPDFKA